MERRNHKMSTYRVVVKTLIKFLIHMNQETFQHFGNHFADTEASLITINHLFAFNECAT